MDGFSVRQAIAGDLYVVLAILDEAAEWLITRGIHQWPSPFPQVVVERDFEFNTVWLASLDGHPVATASILESDPLLWGAADNAWYLHRLAIRRHAAGTGRQLLHWIERQAVQSGITHLRLDCGVGLQRYYEDAEYRLHSSVSLVSATSAPPRSQWFCYQKSLSALS
jgi:GNAT superfamily N-acetyltransferase